MVRGCSVIAKLARGSRVCSPRTGTWYGQTRSTEWRGQRPAGKRRAPDGRAHSQRLRL